MKCIEYADVFHGNGERALPEPEGIAASWFFIKAQTGNTSPAAVLPFGMMTAGPFSGGYPTGCGDHLINCAGRPEQFENGKKLLGFSHLCHSGTGAVGYYYNYAVVTPHYGEPRRFELSDEAAAPGFYSALLDGTLCELTVEPRRALHRYTFRESGAFLTVDFSNDGLTENHGRHRPEELEVCVTDSRTATASGVFQGVRLFMAARCFSPCAVTRWEEGDRQGARFAVEGKNALLAVSISSQSMENTLSFLGEDADFDLARTSAENEWEAVLSRVKIDADERTKRIFYSNLYHSLVKPCDRSGDGFIYGGGPFMTDFITLWDMYKTQLPLVFALYREPSLKIVETLIKAGEALGFLPNSLGLSGNFAHESKQARMLGAYALLSAYHQGLTDDPARMLRVIEADVFSEGKRDFTEEHRCASHTWTLDMADGCAYAAAVAEKEGLEDIAARLRPLGELWKTAYDAGTGLLSADSNYYEGTLYNYSFRPCAHMEERVALAGGAERFAKLLDNFFGYGAEQVVQPTDPRDGKFIEAGMSLGRFEGFNNEPDMETPYSYIFAGRHDRTCEVVRAGMKYMFSDGRGALPGNNDSGGLSSCYVWNALGIFPVAGRDMFLVGSPVVKSAELELSSGKRLEIFVKNNSDENIYVNSVKFNGVELADYRLTASALMSGGRLEIEMKGSK